MLYCKQILSWMMALFSLGYAVLMFGYFGHFLHPRGPGSLLVAIAVVTLPVAHAVLPFWDRHLAAKVGIHTAAATAAIFTITYIVLNYRWLRDRYFWAGVLIIIAFCSLILLPALFWGFAAKHGWPSLTRRRKLAASLVTAFTTVLGATVSLMFAVHQAQLGDCDFISRPYTTQPRP
jgi:hypothetical protein